MGLELAKAFVRVGVDHSAVAGGMTMVQKQVATGMVGVLGVIQRHWKMLAVTLMGGLSVLKALQSAGKFEQTTIAFETMIGSAKETKKTLADLTEFAALTPFEMPEIEQAARGLIQFGERGDDLIDTLNMLGNAASGTSTQFGMIALIYNQIRGVGKLLTQDFRQLSTRGVLSLQDIAKHYGVTTGEAQKMLSKGKITFEGVKAIFKGLSAEGGKFHNLMIKQSKSLLGLWSTFQDAVGITLRTFGQILLPAAKIVVGHLIDIVEWVRAMIGTIAEHERFKKVLHTISIIYGHIKSTAVAAGMAVIGAIQSILGWMGFAVKEGDTLQDTFINVFLKISEAVSNFVLNSIEWIQVFTTNWRLVWDMIKAIANAALLFIKHLWTTYWTDVLPAQLIKSALLMGEILTKLLTDVVPKILFAGLRIWYKMFKNFWTKVFPQLVGAGLSKLVDLWEEHGLKIAMIFGAIMRSVGNFMMKLKDIMVFSLTAPSQEVLSGLVAEMESEMQVGIRNVVASFKKGFVEGKMPTFADLFALGQKDIEAAKAAGKAMVDMLDLKQYSKVTQDAVAAYNKALKKMTTPGEDERVAWEEAMSIYKQLQGFKAMRAMDRPPMLGEEGNEEEKKKKEAEILGNKIGDALIKAGTRIGIADLGTRIQDAMFKAQKDAKKDAKEAKKMQMDKKRNELLEDIKGKEPVVVVD